VKGLELRVKGQGAFVLTMHGAEHVGLQDVMAMAVRQEDGFVLRVPATRTNALVLLVLGTLAQEAGLLASLTAIEGRTVTPESRQLPRIH